MPRQKQITFDIRLQPKQMKLLQAVERGIRHPFFGGAKGGGKSFGSRQIMIARRLKYPQTTGLLLRRTFKQLNGNHILPMLQQYPWMTKWYNKTEQLVRFPNESLLFFGHCEHEQDALQYQGQEFHDIGVEEVTQFTRFQWDRLTESNRTSNPIIKPVMWATGNPGGVGHMWVKKMWKIHGTRSYVDGRIYSYIPAKVTDNPALMLADPFYLQTLKNIDDPEIRKAYLNGDWEIFPGQFFTNWVTDQIHCKSFAIPQSWKIYGGVDYGEAAPTSYGQYAIDTNGWIFRLWGYYMGDRSASQHAKEINARIKNCPYTRGRRPSAIFADPSMWTKRRLDTDAGRSPADVFAEYGLHLTRANNDRVSGWSRCRDVLTSRRFHAFEGQNDAFMRTVPAMPRDDHNVEDVDTSSEDHCGDEWRYVLMHVFRPAQRADFIDYEGTAQQVIDETLAAQDHEGTLSRFMEENPMEETALAWGR